MFPNAFTIVAEKEPLERLQRAALTAGAMQCKLLKLGTAGGFHGTLMTHAVEEYSNALAEALPSMKPPRCDVYMNATGKKIAKGTAPKEIVKILTDQMTSCVQWEQCMKTMIKDGVKEFYELGPSKQLKGILKCIDK